MDLFNKERWQHLSGHTRSTMPVPMPMPKPMLMLMLMLMLFYVVCALPDMHRFLFAGH